MSRLETLSKTFRDATLVKNTYLDGKPYNASHADALSTGDEQGKGETDTIGGMTDIITRNNLATKNKYNSGNEYNSSNA